MNMANRAVNTQLTQMDPTILEEELQTNPNFILEMTQNFYEEILLSQFDITIEQVQAIIGGAVNQAGGGAAAAQQYPDLVPQ